MSTVSRVGAYALAILGVVVMSWLLLSRSPARTSHILASAEIDAVALPLQATPIARTDERESSATPTAATSTLTHARQTVRVVVRLAPDCADTHSLHAELLRLDAGRGCTALTPRDRQSESSRAELSRLTSASSVKEVLRSAEAEFEIGEAGLYAAAWHAWVRVPQTSTWRVRRGQGAPICITLPFDQPERRIEVEVEGTALELDATLDAEPKSNLTTVTAKDG